MQRGNLKKGVKFCLRWGIAIIGVWWVISHISLDDYVLILDAKNIPVKTKLLSPAPENATEFEIQNPNTQQPVKIPRILTVNPPEKPNRPIHWKAGNETGSGTLLGLDLTDDLKLRSILVKPDNSDQGVWLLPVQAPGFELGFPRPRVEIGARRLVKNASVWPLVLSIAVFWIEYLITSVRWHKLLKAVDIQLGIGRVFVLNMVGSFYNTFIPGTTGGDLLKAYYASLHTQHRARAVMSVVVDRVLGLLALIILGGTMAAILYVVSDPANVPVRRACRQVAGGAVVLMIAAFVGFEVIAKQALRKRFGVEFLISKLPANNHVNKVIQVVEIYRNKLALTAGMTAFSIPVHVITVISAMLAGKAFGLPMPMPYYFVCVPVIVLSGAIPISPQGAGVMEFFAVALTRQHGMTVSQALALTMSIRLVSIFWNLSGGIFVFKGGYHAPTVKEEQEMQEDR